MTNSFTIQPHVASLKRYTVGENQVSGLTELIRLASNEHASLPTPRVQQALLKSLQAINRYADASHQTLITALSNFYEIDPTRVVCGNGSSELILLLAQALATSGDEVLTWKYGYSFYEFAACRVGASLVRADSTDFVDVDSLLKKVTTKTKLVFLDNPNNPTGAFVPKQELFRLRENLRSDIVLVIDAAYAEYVTDEQYDSGLALVQSFDNVCMLRTFSKIYALAGARIGWLYGPQALLDVIRILQQPTSVSHAAQNAAEIALQEQAWVAQVRTQNHQLRNQFYSFCEQLQFKAYPSQGNFVLVDFHSVEGANWMFQALKQRGILVRPIQASGLSSCLRFTMGSMQDMLSVQDQMRKLLGSVDISTILAKTI